MDRHLSILVSGRVQGVFFRAATKRKADELGITGFVRNQPDGSVYIEAEGDPDNLSVFESWCSAGPPRAQVERVDIKKGNLQFFSEFNIK